MAVPERSASSDGMTAAMQLLMNLGGSKQTTTNTTNVDPAAIAALSQLLQTQLGQSTIGGNADFLKAIFSEGMNQVPGLATTYGQAAGARTTGNSPFQLALQDLMTKLTMEAAKGISTQQQNAGQTAERLANASKSETSKVTKGNKASAMQLVPFALANAGKLKSLGSDVVDFGSSLFSSPSSATVGGSGLSPETVYGSGSGFGLDILDAGSTDLASSGLDFSSSGTEGFLDVVPESTFDYSVFTDDIDYGAFFADGGLVSRSKMQRMKAPGYDQGGYVNRAAEKAFDSGGDEPEKKTGSSEESSQGEFFYKKKRDNSKAEDAPVKEDKTGRNSVGVQIIRFLQGKEQKPAGYATGGPVRDASKDITSSDRLSNSRTASGGQIRGVTYNRGTDFRNLLTDTINRNTGGGRPLRPQRFEETDFGPSGEGIGIATGQVGTPAENQAAINGMVALGLSLAGIPGVSLAMDAAGIPNTSMNPISQLISFAINSISSLSADSMSQNEANTIGMTASPDAVAGMSVPGVNNSGMSSVAGVNNGLAGLDALGLGMADAPTTGGDASTGAGNSGVGGAGDAASSSVGSSSGDTAYAKGGEVDGPKGRDVIPAYLTDGEYVIKQPVVDLLGIEFFDMINDMIPGGSKGAR